MEIKEFSNVEELEFHFFKILDIKTDFIEGDILNKIEGLFGRNVELCRVVKILEGKVICGYGWNRHYSCEEKREYEQLLVFENLFDLKEEDFILINKEGGELEKLWKVEGNVLNKDFLDKCKKDVEIRFETIKDDDILTREIVEIAVEKTAKKEKEDREKYAREEKILEKGAEGKKKDLIKKFKKEGVGEFENGIKVNKNEIIDNSFKYILKDNVNKVLDFDFFDRKYFSGSGNLHRIEEALIDIQESYTKQKEGNNDNWIKIYNLGFKTDKKKEILASLTDKKYHIEIKLNGVKISKAKVGFIISRINKDTPKEKIKLLNKLTGMKVDVLNFTELRVDSHNIDIKVSLIDEDNFKVKFVNVTKKVDWTFLRKHFFDNGSSRTLSSYFNKSGLLNLVEDFGIDRQKFYDYFKRIVMVDKLGEQK